MGGQNSGQHAGAPGDPPATRPHADPQADLRADIEAAVEQFESAFGTSGPKSIEQLVRDLPEATRRAAVRELVHTELELRLRNGEPARVEQFLARFPELSDDGSLILELAETEVRFRQRTDAPATRDEVRARFAMVAPQELERLVAALPDGEGEAAWPLRLSCPHCNEPISGSGADHGSLTCPACRGTIRIQRDRDLTWEARRLPKLGRFQLLEVVGRGTFGTVYRAQDTDLDRIVAVKVPRSGSFSSTDDEDRFVREGRSVARLSHPGIVTVYEVGRTAEFPYIVAEFVDGITLDDAISDRRIGLSEAAELVAEIALTLDHVHRNGVVHRDLKPSNIILQPVNADERDSDSLRRGDSAAARSAGGRGRHTRLHPRLMDFGLARLDQGDGTLTLDNQILGTPAWMSPEQAEGRGHAADGRSDLYSLGVIFYQLLTGDTPFRGNARMLRFQVLHDDPSPPRKLNDAIPRDLETICLTAMARDPARRYQTGADLAADVYRSLRGEPIQARPVGRLERAWRLIRRNALVSALTALVALSLVAGTVISAMFAIQAGAARNRLDVQLRLNELETALSTSRFTAEERAAFDAEVQEIRELSASAATTAESVIAEAWSRQLARSIRSLRVLNQDVIAELRADIDQLTARDPQRGAEIRQLMSETLQAPVRLIDSTDRDSAIFDGGVVETVEVRDAIRLARTGPIPEEDSILVPTVVPGRGDQQMDATFHGQPAAGKSFGLILNFARPPVELADQETYRGYAFVVDALDAERSRNLRPRLLAEAQESAAEGDAATGDEGAGAAADGAADGVWAMRIFRGDVLLRESHFLHPTDADAMTLSVFRSGQELTLVVNSEHRLRFRDVLGPAEDSGGVFALVWPRSLQVADLRAWGRAESAAPPAATLLSAADHAFAEARWPDALAAYRDAEQRSDIPELRQEAVFRQGLCLLQTDPELAVPVFSRLATDDSVPGSVWPLSAACQWWLLLLQDGNFAAADDVLTLLAARETTASPTFEQLAAILPLSVRNTIVARYLSAGTAGGYDAIRPHPDRLQNVERIVRLHELIRVPPREIVVQRNALARIYMERKRYTEAQAVWMDLLNSPLSEDPEYAAAFADFLDISVWNLLLLGRPDDALTLLEDFEVPWDGSPETEPRLTVIMKARVLAAKGQPAEALDLVLPLLEGEPVGLLPRSTRAQAFLVAGFLYEDLGQPDRAQQMWRDGLAYIREEDYFGEFSIAASLLCSLSGEMTVQDTDRLVAGVLNQVSVAGLSSVALNFANSGVLPRPVLHGILRNLWSSERGRPFARGIVMQELDYDQSNYAQVLLCGFLAWRHALTNAWDDEHPLTDDESAAIWQMCQDAFVAYRNEQLKEPQVVTLAMVHIGQPFLWINARESVPPVVRGPLDYVHGCQYRRHLDRAAEARQFLEWARDDADAVGDERLRRLVDRELSQLD